MGKFVMRIGWCGFAVACALFAASRWIAHPAPLDRIEPFLWPASILFASHRIAPPRLGLDGSFKVAFSALMNGAFYSGIAWVVWWAAHLAGMAKAAPSAKGRFISFLLALCLVFSVLVALAEAAIHRPAALTAQGARGIYLISANLFALIVLACAMSGWALWWLRGFLGRRAERVGRA